MRDEIEKIVQINHLANEMLKEIVRCGHQLEGPALKGTVENLARSVIDLTNIQLGKESDMQTTLKGTLIKTRLAYNSLLIKKKEGLPL